MPNEVQVAADELSAALRAWKVAVDRANACSSDVAAAKATKIVHMAKAIVRDGGLSRALVNVLLDLLRHNMPFPSTAAGYVRRRDGENTTATFTYRGSTYAITIIDDGWSSFGDAAHFGRTEFRAGGEVVLAMRLTDNMDPDWSSWREYDLDAFKAGPWMADLLALAGDVEAKWEAEKRARVNARLFEQARKIG